MNKILSDEIILYIEKCFSAAKTDYAAFFKELKQKYRGMDVALICNYILENKDNPDLLKETIKVINSNKYRENFETLLAFLSKTNDVNLKFMAIKTIAIYKNIKALESLVECLNNKDSSYKIRFAAADAIGKIGGKTAFEALKYVAIDEEEKSTYVKESAVAALGNLGDDRAVDVFSSILSSKRVFPGKMTYLKERIIEAISKLNLSKDIRVAEILKKSLLEPDSRVRISTIEAIMNLEIDGCYDLIYDRLLNDKDFEVKKNALIALYNISGRKILDEVLEGEFDISLKSCAQEIMSEYEADDE